MTNTGISDLQPQYDAIIVGARCAGAATAMLLARQGLRVLAIDRRPYGADALSTHALMRAGVLQLHRWGVLGRVREAGTPAVRATSFYYGDDALVVPIESRGGVDALYAPRRNLLDRILADAARAAGAELRFGVSLRELVRSPAGRVSGVLLNGVDGRAVMVGAAIVIGADGISSRVAAAVDARIYREALHTGATAYTYFSELPQSGYHWYWNHGIAAGVIPTNDGLSCVFVEAPPDRMATALRGDADAGFRHLLGAALPADDEVLRGGRRVTPYRRFAGMRGYMRRSYGPGWALVGDAGYFKDPITAHGISDALRDAELLTRAVLEDTTCAYGSYQTARDELSEALFTTTDRVAAFDWDLDEIRVLHQDLSLAMRAENRAIAALDASTERAA